VPRLSEHYATITLGGAELGMVAMLEKRGREAGYLAMISHLMEAARLQPGESVLEVGCGTGVLDRWLAQHSQGGNPITCLDISAYLLREASALARRDGLEGQIAFREGNAEALPYPEDRFDMTMSATVLEEVDADKALAEMVRVTKPGGRVAIAVRATDVPFFINLPMRDELRAQVQDPSSWAAGVAKRGCGDASLYRRFLEAGLAQVKMFLHLATFSRPSSLNTLHQWFGSRLNADEAAEWQKARELGEAEGTFFISWPHHCAVGTKAR
jgi:ubiquinone/menaquinone biosynthesis C-methylase UbiE